MQKKVEIAKPVASRPCGNFRSFPEVLERAMSSPPSSVAQKLIAIRPKTVRLRTASFDSSDKDDVSQSVPSHSPEKEPVMPDPKLNLLYKPTAKAVSRATASLLANLGNFDAIHQQPEAANIPHPIQATEQTKPNYEYRPTAAHQQNPSSQFDRMNQTTYEALNSVPQNSEADMRNQQVAGPDRPSFDGYNWRKYGQKQVKGSEYPRSYYKCTHPTCPVKKKVERSFDGQIAEIVYKGEHNHPKPQPPRRLSSASQEQGFVTDEHGREAGNNPSWTNSMLETNVPSGGIESMREASLPSISTYGGQVQFPLADAVYDCHASSTDGAAGIQVLTNPGRGVTGVHDRSDFKRRRCEDRVSATNSVGEASTDPQSVMHTTMESDVSGDGYHWRKYGQKVVKGNTYPRSYYKCTSPKCGVRKYVEKASDESGYFVTTYEGKHNHEMPLRKPSFAASNADPAAAAALDSSYN